MQEEVIPIGKKKMTGMKEEPLVQERGYGYGAREVCRQFLGDVLEALKDQIDEEHAKAIMGLTVL